MGQIDTDQKPDYRGFGAQAAGVLDGYVDGKGAASATLAVSSLIDLAERCGIKIGEEF